MGLLDAQPRLQFFSNPRLGLLDGVDDDAARTDVDSDGWNPRGGLLRIPATALPQQEPTGAAVQGSPLAVRAGDFGGSLERIARARLGGMRQGTGNVFSMAPGQRFGVIDWNAINPYTQPKVNE